MLDDQPLSDDDSRILARLQSLQEALERGDGPRCRELVDSYPELAPFAGCLELLAEFSRELDSPPDGDNGSDATVLGHFSASPPSTDFTDHSRSFGRYDLLDELGRGAMGVVYRARHRDLNRLVAVKMISSGQLAGRDLVDRFYQEARAAARLRHPHIVGIHDIGEVSGQHYFAMDFVAGRSLAEHLQQNGLLHPEQAASLLATIAEAVHYLHAQGIVHRDLKPANILLDDQFAPYVADFGLAKVFEAGSVQTRTGAIVGTPSYMSPEQAAGRTDRVSPRSDVYSLGAILYELITGRPPFREPTWTETVIQVLEGEPIRPTRINAAVPIPLERICLKALEKDPERRYASAADLAADLKRFLQNEPVDASSGGIWHQVVRWARRQPALACHWGAIAIAALIIQIHGWLFPEDAGNYRLIELLLAGWALLSGGWQWLANRDRTEDLGKAGFLVTDVAIVTAFFPLASGPPGTLLVLFPLLIAASGLWFQTRLVWLTTAASILGTLFGAAVMPALRTPWHYPLIVVTVLFVTGLAVTHQVDRVRALSRFYDRRPGLESKQANR